MNDKEFPITCTECGEHVWQSAAIIYNNMPYCEKCGSAEPSCPHKKVTVYDKLVSFQTFYEPAEYEFKITCDECDEEFNEIPEGSESKQEPWGDDFDYEM